MSEINLNGLKGVSAWGVYNKLIFSMVFLRRFNNTHNDQLALIEVLKTCESLEDYTDVTAKLSSDKFKKVYFTQAEIVTFFKASNESDKRNMLLEALTINEISDDDCLRLLALHTDSNGVPYSRNNIKNVLAGDIIPKMLETLLKCAELECDFSLMDETELDIIKGKRVGIKDETAKILSSNSDIITSDLLSLVVKRVISRFK